MRHIQLFEEFGYGMNPDSNQQPSSFLGVVGKFSADEQAEMVDVLSKIEGEIGNKVNWDLKNLSNWIHYMKDGNVFFLLRDLDNDDVIGVTVDSNGKVKFAADKDNMNKMKDSKAVADYQAAIDGF